MADCDRPSGTCYSGGLWLIAKVSQGSLLASAVPTVRSLQEDLLAMHSEVSDIGVGVRAANTNSLCIQQLTEAGWLQVNYASIEIQLVRTWQFFDQVVPDLLSTAKSTMHDLPELLQIANVNTKKLTLKTT